MSSWMCQFPAPDLSFLRRPLIWICLVSGLSLTGCAATNLVTPMPGAPSPGPLTSRELTVTTSDSLPAKPFEVLGKVFTYKRGATIFSAPTKDSQARTLAELAKQLGATSVIGIHSSPFNGTDRNTIHRWTSGLAVTFPQVEQTPSAPGELVVAISVAKLPAKISSNSAHASKMTTWLRESAQYWLEKKGYYAFFVDTTAGATDSSGLAAMSSEEVGQIGGPLADRLLLLSVRTGGANVGVAAVKSATIRAIMYSKRKREIVWSNTAAGSTFGLGLINVIAMSGDIGNSAAIYRAVRETLKNVPAPN